MTYLKTKRKAHLLFILAIALILYAYTDNKNKTKDSGALDGEEFYLGQHPPGLIPELFAPDISRTAHREAAPAFTPDLREFYFHRRGGKYENMLCLLFKTKVMDGLNP